MLSTRTIALISTAISLGLTAAFAQQHLVRPEAKAESCSASQRGSPNCPDYTAPAATALPGPSMDGSMLVPYQISTTLFNGAVPPNGFTIRAEGIAVTSCLVSDSGAANGTGVFISPGGPITGFLLLQDQVSLVTSSSYSTPHGYKPIGPVSVWCTNQINSPTYVAARGW
jgi:hypothetical protein